MPPAAAFLKLTTSGGYSPFRAPVRPFRITFSLPREEQKRQNLPVKYWELVADKLSKAGWSLGWISALDREGRTIWIVDAHRDDGKGLSFGVR